MNSILSIVVLLLIAVASCAVDYCNLESCKKGEHTMCAYPAGLSANCGKRVVVRGLSKAEKDEIVKTHNNMRAKVASGKEKRGAPGPQPPAKEMSKLTWDNELEKIAQRWADQCEIEHDKCRHVPQYQVGQNIGGKFVKGVRNNSTMSSIVDLWYNEVDQFDGRTVSSGITESNYMDVGHYTQLVWGTTKKIGCGRITYFDDDDWEKLYVVCNYGPAGNFLHRPVYST